MTCSCFFTCLAIFNYMLFILDVIFLAVLMILQSLGCWVLFWQEGKTLEGPLALLSLGVLDFSRMSMFVYSLLRVVVLNPLVCSSRTSVDGLRYSQGFFPSGWAGISMSVSIEWLSVSHSAPSPPAAGLMEFHPIGMQPSLLQVLGKIFYIDCCILSYASSSPLEHCCTNSSCLNSI